MGDADIEDIFAALGKVTIKRMFGGKGIYHRGRIVAVEVQEEILLKADALSAPEFMAAGARRWDVHGQGRQGRRDAVLVDPGERFRRP